MDPKPEDIAAVLAGNQTVAEPGAPVTGHLWNEYWKEVGRWAPWLGMAVRGPTWKPTWNATSNGDIPGDLGLRPALWPSSQPRFNQAMRNLATEGARPVKSATNPTPMSLDAITQMLRTIEGKTPPANQQTGPFLPLP